VAARLAAAAEVEPLKAELAAMQGISIRGAGGEFHEKINGVYLRNDEVKNDKPVFVKTNGAYFCWCGPDTIWYVSTARRKDNNDPGGYCHSERGAGFHPAIPGVKWKVYDARVGEYIFQPALEVKAVFDMVRRLVSANMAASPVVSVVVPLLYFAPLHFLGRLFPRSALSSRSLRPVSLACFFLRLSTEI
jgi:hypothetical protein